MTALLLERSPLFSEGFEHGASGSLDHAQLVGAADDARGRLTLDDLITGVWEGLAVRGTVDCPVCESQMASSSHGGDAPRGVCTDCGSSLC